MSPVPAEGGAILRADWPAPAAVTAFTTLRHGAGVSAPPFDTFNLGARCGDEPAAVARNRDRLQRRFGLPAPPHWLRQVHGKRVVRFDAPALPLGERAGEQDEPEADAAVTSAPGVVLAILTADCLPVVFAARDGREVGAAHAGWRGLAGGVLEATRAAMRTAPGDLLAWLGPAAGPRAYEIGQEVFDAFTAGDPGAADAFAATRPGHWQVDLYALARRRLAVAGVTAVYGGDRCTIGEADAFFSHRRDRRSGRMATLAWIAL
ncbi:MAG: peptidoglycan editing factor PgeF [Pseudoxanthomonas sp.]